MNHKIQQQSTAISIVKSWQQQGLEVVFTNGCFDLLHVGHIRYLAKSGSYGDKLVVGVNTDDSVTRLKGAGRPVNRLEDRIEVLSALEMTDLIVSFDADTPLELITALDPDILTKGGDYTIETIVGADVVQEHGGTVIVIPFEDGYSTTDSLDRMRNKDK